MAVSWMRNAPNELSCPVPTGESVRLSQLQKVCGEGGLDGQA